MKQLNACFLLIMLLFFGYSCTKPNNCCTGKVKGDYMIVGNAGGFVNINATSTYYLISNGQLWKDTTVSAVNPPTDISKFNFNILMPNAKFETVKNLYLKIPTDLLAMNNKSIGNTIPDAGYTDVRTSINGKNYSWEFYYDLSGTSTAIQQFADSISVLFK